MSEALKLMQAGRFREAAAIYEQTATAARQANDLRSMKGNALMTVQAYACAGDGPQALRFAVLTLDILAASPLASEIPAFARTARKSLHEQGHDALAAELDARVAALTGVTRPPRLPKFCSQCGIEIDPRAVLMPGPSVYACHRCGATLDVGQ